MSTTRSTAQSTIHTGILGTPAVDETPLPLFFLEYRRTFTVRIPLNLLQNHYSTFYVPGYHSTRLGKIVGKKSWSQLVWTSGRPY